ncbi:hypothetical protein ACFL6G_02390 [candidate division KSB1 bacterium]
MQTKNSPLGNGIVKKSVRPVKVRRRGTNNFCLCYEDCLDNYDENKPADEQFCPGCREIEFDLGG